MLVYTLGTTGPPKAIMWQHQDLARVLAGSMDFHLDRRGARRLRGSHQGAGHPEWLVLVPLGDAAGVMPTLTALLCGHTVVPTSRFDPDEIWRIVAENRPQVVVSAGDAMARPLLDAYRRCPTDATSLTTIASCAAPLSQSVKNELLEQFPWTDVFEAIGSSETGLRGAGVARKDDDLARRSRFHLAPRTVVVDADGAPTETGAEGYLAATRNLPLGYYKDQRGTDSLPRSPSGKPDYRRVRSYIAERVPNHVLAPRCPA